MKSFRIVFFVSLAFWLISSAQYSESSIEHLTYQFEVIKELIDHKDPVHAVAFSPDESLIVSGSADSTIKLWDAESGKRIKAIMRHPFPILSAAFSPGGNIVVAGSEAGTITLWDVNYKERIKTLKGHTDGVLSIRFNSSGSILASGSADHTVRLWDMVSGKEMQNFGDHKGSVNSLAFSPDGKVLASGSADGTVKLWNVESGKSILTLQGNTGAVNSVCFTPDGSGLAAGLEDGTIRLWSVDSGEEIRKFASERKAAIGIDDCLVFSPDSKILLSGAANAKITVWDTSSGNMIEELRAHVTDVYSVILNSDGRRMVSAGENGVIKIWRIRVKENLEITLDAEYTGWQRGTLELRADILGLPDVVRFQYSTDGSTWLDIAEKQRPPYIVEWNTRAAIPGLAKTVNLRAVAERVTGTTAIDMAAGSFSVDNEPPETKHNYDDRWHKEGFSIELSADDGDGTGIDAIEYNLNYSKEQNVMWEGQPEITEEGINVLEYWSVDKMGNEEPHKVLSEIKLDKTAPTFFGWSKEPENLAEGATGPLLISVHVNDEGGSELVGMTPQFDYHIGLDTAYDGYEKMSTNGGSVWYYSIPEPPQGWTYYGGKAIYYRITCQDVAGNISQSAEQQELIGSSKVPPTAKITNAIRDWESGIISMDVEVSDLDGTIEKVQFEYSLDSVSWTQIEEDDTSPFSIKWNTKSDIPDVKINVWARVTAIDNDGLSGQYITPRFGIDNQLPETSHDYDGLWHKKNFTVNLTASEVGGSGVSSTKYRLNDGGEKDISTDGQPVIDEQGKNVLEYWSIDVAGNEEEHKMLSGVKLDRLSPLFKSWSVEQEGNILHVKAKIADADSGIKIAPQIGYHIGQDTRYSGYKEMQKTDDGWRYDLDVSGRLSGITDRTAFFKVSAKDAVGNLAIEMWEHEITGAVDDIPTTAIEPEPEQVAREEELNIKQEPESVPDTDLEPKPVIESKGKESFIVWSSQASGTAKLGDKVNIRGSVKPNMDKPIPVNLTVMAPDDTVYVSQIDTDLNGAFRFDLPLTSGGEWRVIADWRGDSVYKPAKSQALTFQVFSEEQEKPKEPEQAKKAKGFLRKNTVIIGLIFFYILAIRLYKS